MFGTKTLSEIKAELRAARSAIGPKKHNPVLEMALDKALTELESDLRKVRKPKRRPRAKKR
jgi:hypothetical protein